MVDPFSFYKSQAKGSKKGELNTLHHEMRNILFEHDLKHNKTKWNKHEFECAGKAKNRGRERVRLSLSVGVMNI